MARKLNLELLSKMQDDGAICRICTLCSETCGALESLDNIDYHVKKNWIKHWKKSHIFELSILKHRSMLK